MLFFNYAWIGYGLFIYYFISNCLDAWWTSIVKHWYAVLAVENPKDFNLKINYHLREEHIKPEYYQKMNVALAFQVNINISGTDKTCAVANLYSSQSTLVLDEKKEYTGRTQVHAGTRVRKSYDRSNYFPMWRKLNLTHRVKFLPQLPQQDIIVTHESPALRTRSEQFYIQLHTLITI